MADSINDVLDQLESIVDQTRADSSRAGYFAAMYWVVTKAIKQAISDGEFEDGPRMAELDVVFAKRYIDAFDRHNAQEQPSSAWQVSFLGADKWRPIIVQQLLTGMNAHINLDLGVAAATIAPGDSLAELHADFNKINEVLARMTDRFIEDIDAVSPWIEYLDRIGGKAEQHVIKFSIDAARDAAWDLAERLAPLHPEEWSEAIEERDRWTAELGRLILHPGLFLSLGLFVVRVRESNNVSRIIDLLANS